jgi:NAD(P)-dependent dehydrogenase (short-subunit alcohol dehydrogenase family)
MLGNNLKDKKIIISAGASGIGWAITKICISRGAIIYLCDINHKAINKVKKHRLYNKKIFTSEVDASNEIEVINFFDSFKKKFKKLDALINNVGIQGPTGNIESLDSNQWENTLHVNVNSHFYFSKQAIPLLKKSKSGSIINISSGAGIMGFPLRSPYAASKWAIVGMTKTLAMELGKYKIRVNAICPGTIKGERMKKVIRDKAKFLKNSQKSIEKEFISMASMNCWINEEDIGKLCSFLISEDSERISGQVIGVDGNAVRMD